MTLKEEHLSNPRHLRSKKGLRLKA